MPTTTATRLNEHDEFVDVVSGDVDLLRAEFDAIIDANWPESSTPLPHRQPAPYVHPGPWSRNPSDRVRLEETAVVREWRGRERAPPRSGRDGDIGVSRGRNGW